MAEIRFNYGDKFTQTSDSNTGIGSTIPAGKLDVAGGASAGCLRVSGIATLSSYQGFVNTKLSTTEDLIVEAGQSGSVSGEVVVSTGQTISVSTGATTGQGGIQSLKAFETFMPPVGGTADRPTDVKPGMVYYNKDFKTIEFWDGNFWKQVDNMTRSGRGVYGGQGPYAMDYINIASKGNSINFGDFSTASGGIGDGAGNETRGIFSGHGPNYRAMQYITIASEGRSVSFGDATTNTSPNSSTRVCEANSTRFLNMGDYLWTNVIDYVQIHTIGNALDFGDLSQNRAQGTGFSSPIRAMYCGGYVPGGNHVSDIDVVKFASLGNAIHFGDLIKKRKTNGGGTSNSVRGVVGGGTLPATDDGVNFIEFITLASEGNGTEFGNLTANTKYASAVGSQTRAVFSGGSRNDAASNIIDFIEIATGGNAQDFGDVAGTTVFYNNGLSDCHGGLGGF